MEFLANHFIRVQIVRYINGVAGLQKNTDRAGKGTSCTAVKGTTGGPSGRDWALFFNIIQGKTMPVPVAARSSAARLLRLWVRIPPGTWTSVLCDCCVLSGRGLCDELITRPEDSYRLWYVVVCDLETS